MTHHGAKATLLVLGWYAPEQRRLDFVATLSNALGMSKSQALGVLNESLQESVPLLVQFAELERVRSLGAQLEACGCEVRVVPGDVREHGSIAGKTFAAIRNEVRTALQLGASGEVATAIRAISPALRP
jgi:hypothetical protein